MIWSKWQNNQYAIWMKRLVVRAWLVSWWSFQRDVLIPLRWEFLIDKDSEASSNTNTNTHQGWLKCWGLIFASEIELQYKYRPRLTKVYAQVLLSYNLNSNSDQVDQRVEEQYNLPPWDQVELAERLLALQNPTVILMIEIESEILQIIIIIFDEIFLQRSGYGISIILTSMLLVLLAHRLCCYRMGLKLTHQIKVSKVDILLQWLGLVRDPVERVISNFYYR